MPKTISRDLPLSEFTFRRYEKPYDMSRRDLIRKLCLSTGLLQPGDSRDVVVDVLHALLDAKVKKLMMNSEQVKDEVINLRKKNKLNLKGVAGSNIRRQLKRLRDLLIAEKIKNEYRITEFEDLHVLFDSKIEEYLIKSVVSRVKEYFKAVK
ncbi:MAG: hypothetical protein Q8R00_02875 [Candidatus Nanoarchaeia archaeon]|nr:hypothetical protein [Candidatus Nanoarchaeia archaeon]